MIDQDLLKIRLKEYIKKEEIRDIIISELIDLYRIYKDDLDRDWLEITINSDDNSLEERLLELVVAKHMNQKNSKFTKYPAKKNKKAPDFLFRHENYYYGFEVTSIRPPNSGSIIEKNIEKFEINKCLSSYEDYNRIELANEIKSRVTNAFQQKADKYDLSNVDKGLIILISTGKIPFHSRIDTYELINVFLGIGKLTLTVDPAESRIITSYYDHQKSFTKNNGKEIPNVWFLDQNYRHVSGVILSQTMSLSMLDWTKEHTEVYCWGDKILNDFVLIHNPNAIYPISKEVLPVRNEVFLDMKNQVITCLNENLYPII